MLAPTVWQTHTTMQGVYLLLCNPYSMLQLRAGLDGDAYAHGGTKALRSKHASVEEVYASTEGLVADMVVRLDAVMFHVPTSKERTCPIPGQGATGEVANARRGVGCPRTTETQPYGFAGAEGRGWRPATEETARLYEASLLDTGWVQAALMQPNLSATNQLPRGHGL
ncbi:hypothetical protein CYMTET_52794 [Cymbomonas tetramitiformis]|uniref:Uncharacterized protein n=1 Tax=Cymbomonas tetramitiformis TaxID=36881 RepID=A0AAE0EQG7_9CHLO|nr:hypothetical protein CYMTET_52794 [Cymbomonas tetramitiformis]